ncbi:MAG: hypothetical protein ABSE20_27985 [Acetobacteraceae bacterium]
MKFSWELTEDGAQYATIIAQSTGVVLRLVIEKIPDSEFWDWVVWQDEATSSTTQGGKEQSLPAAITAAENAAKNSMPGNRNQSG